MNKLKTILMVLVAGVLFASCGTTSTVPITGRKHRLNYDDATMLSLSTQQYQQYMSQAKVSTNATNTALVKKVGQKLATAVNNYLVNNGFAADAANFAWEFNLVQENEVNAFCMPGGKIIVYEGLLPVTQDESSLAIVLGHEIAHAVAKHSAEQMTKSNNSSTLLNIGSGIATAVLGNNTVTQIGTSVAQQGLTLLNLKYSRSHESEADYMGLIFAAMAGYDPQVALTFWQRMAASGSAANPEWLSSHPSDATRISDLQAHMPEALAVYRQYSGASAASTPATTSKKASKSKSSTTKKNQGLGFSIGK